MTYLILVTTPFRLFTPLTWWKVIKRKLFKRDYDTVYFSTEIDKEIYVFKNTLFGYVKKIKREDWTANKYNSKVIPINTF